MDVWTEIAPYVGIIAGLVLISGFFSGTEVAMFALRRVDREQMTRSGRRADRRVLALLAMPRRLITTVMIGNEAINATIAALLVLAVGDAVPEATDLAHAGVAAAVALPVIVLLGEVTAKTLALKAPMAWSRGTAGLLGLLTMLVAPVRWVVQGASELVLKPFGGVARARPDRDLSEAEFRSMIDAGSAHGQIDARERRIIHRVFEFSDKSVGDVMTPRDKIVALSYDLPWARLAKEVAAKGFSRIPIYQRSLDNVRGILQAKDLVGGVAGRPQPRALAELLHEPLFVPRTTPIKRLFRIFKQKKTHLALVVNEYGKVLGLVTMDDLLAQLFGAIRDEREGQQRAALRKGRGGRTPAPLRPNVVVPTGEGGEGLETPPAHDAPGDHTPSPGSPIAEAGEGEGVDDTGGFSELTPPPVDPAEAQRQLRDLAELEDEVTPPPVEVLSTSPALPIPVRDAPTGPSGPVRKASGEGEGR